MPRTLARPCLSFRRENQLLLEQFKSQYVRYPEQGQLTLRSRGIACVGCLLDFCQFENPTTTFNRRSCLLLSRRSIVTCGYSPNVPSASGSEVRISRCPSFTDGARRPLQSGEKSFRLATHCSLSDACQALRPLTQPLLTFIGCNDRWLPNGLCKI